MKYIKSLLLAIAVSGSFTATAQRTLGGANGSESSYLPEAGDIAFGVDLLPIAKTVCNAFSDDYKYDNEGVGGVPFLFDDNGKMYIKPNISIMGKYMLTDNWGIKANIGLKFSNKTNRVYVDDQLGLFINPDSEAKVVDSESLSKSGCTLMVGGEYRIGQRRVQGVFGFGLLAGVSSKSVKYSYGNKLTDANRNPITGITIDDKIPDYIANQGYRITNANYKGPNYALGAYVSAGIEWFLGKKIALGASVDIYCYGNWSSKAVVKSEGFNNAYNSIEKRTDLVSPGNRGWALGTDNVGGSLYTIFYF